MNLRRIDQHIVAVLQKYGIATLRVSLAVVFIWFGVLKPFGLSPAEALVKRTVYWFSPDVFFPILGWWEVAIGMCLLWRPLLRVALLLLFLQMSGTMLPLVILPEACFTVPPFGLTLEGQYIVKNLVLISAAIVVGATVNRPSTPACRL